MSEKESWRQKFKIGEHPIRNDLYVESYLDTVSRFIAKEPAKDSDLISQKKTTNMSQERKPVDQGGHWEYVEEGTSVRKVWVETGKAPAFGSIPDGKTLPKIIPGENGAPPIGLTDGGKTVYSKPRMADARTDTFPGISKEPKVPSRGIPTPVKWGAAIAATAGALFGLNQVAKSGIFSPQPGENPNNNPTVEPGTVINPSEGPTSGIPSTDVPLVTATGETVTETQESSPWNPVEPGSLPTPEGGFITPIGEIDGQKVNPVIIKSTISDRNVVQGEQDAQKTADGLVLAFLKVKHHLYQLSGGTMSLDEFKKKPTTFTWNGKTFVPTEVDEVVFGEQGAHEPGQVDVATGSCEIETSQTGGTVVKANINREDINIWDEGHYDGFAGKCFAVGQKYTSEELSGEKDPGSRNLDGPEMYEFTAYSGNKSFKPAKK